MDRRYHGKEATRTRSCLSDWEARRELLPDFFKGS